MSDTHRVVIVGFDQATLLDISGPAQVFASANHVESARHQLYEVIIASEQGGLITSNSGVEINSVRLDSIEVRSIQTLLVAGGTITTQPAFPVISNWIAQNQNQIARIGSVCTGAFITAQSGILDNRRAVTHWRYFDEFKNRFPAVQAERDPIYIRDQNIWSSAGITAGIDLAIAMIQEDFGRQIALETARDNVVFFQRPGGQNQFSVMLDTQTKDEEGRFDELHHWILNNLTQPLTVEQLADKMRMSPRNFSRQYTSIIGTPPARSIELMRLENARRLLESGSLKLSRISQECGFGSEEKMRRTFLRHLGITAKEYRLRFKD